MKLDKQEKLHLKREVLERMRETIGSDIIQLSRDEVEKVEERIKGTLKYKFDIDQRESQKQQIQFKKKLMRKEMDKISTQLKTILEKLY